MLDIYSRFRSAGCTARERMVRPGALHGRHLHQRPSRYRGKYRRGNGLHRQGQVMNLSAPLYLVQFNQIIC